MGHCLWNYGCVFAVGDADIERRRRRCTGFDSGILVRKFQDGEGLDLMLMDHSSEQELITLRIGVPSHEAGLKRDILVWIREGGCRVRSLV